MIPKTPEFEELPEIEVLKKRIEKIEKIIKKEKLPEDKERRVKEEIKEYLKEFQKTLPKKIPLAARDEAKEIKKFPTTQQVGALISLVFEKGLPYATSVAKSLKNPALLDEFHDTLVDCYYNILLEKGFLKLI